MLPSRIELVHRPAAHPPPAWSIPLHRSTTPWSTTSWAWGRTNIPLAKGTSILRLRLPTSSCLVLQSQVQDIVEHDLWECIHAEGTDERHVKLLPSIPKFKVRCSSPMHN